MDPITFGIIMTVGVLAIAALALLAVAVYLIMKKPEDAKESKLDSDDDEEPLEDTRLSLNALSKFVNLIIEKLNQEHITIISENPEATVKHAIFGENPQEKITEKGKIKATEQINTQVKGTEELTKGKKHSVHVVFEALFKDNSKLSAYKKNDIEINKRDAETIVVTWKTPTSTLTSSSAEEN